MRLRGIDLVRSPSVRIAGLYFGYAASWIVLTDRLIAGHQTLKGVGFVLASAMVIGVLMHRAWEARERTERRFQAVVENAAEIITIIDGEGRRLYHSPAIERVLGYKADDLIGRDIFDYVLPEDQPATRTLLKEVAERPGSQASTEVRVTAADGEVRYLHVTGTNLLEDPSVRGIVLNTRDITTRKRAEQLARRQYNRLAALHAIDLAILESNELSSTLDVVLERVQASLEIDAVSVLHYDADNELLYFAHGRGFGDDLPPQGPVALGDCLAGEAVRSGRPKVVSRMGAGERPACATGGQPFLGYVAIPLVVKGKTRGVMELFSREALRPAPDWLSFATSLGAQTAIAIEDAELLERLTQANAELEEVYDRTLEGWARALELRDDETEGHSRRVVDLTLFVAREMGVDCREFVHLRRGALLHDIGKIGIPDSILLKPGPLDEREWEVMRRHPVYAYELLKSIPYLRPALDIPRFHHERWDGSGYPYGLAGEDIPLAARIFAVVDAYDALTSDRPYRLAWSKERALEYLQEEAGRLFDPEACRALMNVVDCRPGTMTDSNDRPAQSA